MRQVFLRFARNTRVFFSIFHDTRKLSPAKDAFPELLAYLTFFTDFVAGACLITGLFTLVAAAMVAIEMLVIVFVFQWQFGFFWTNRGYEYALLLMLLSIAIFFRGGGKCSVDRLIGREF